MKECMILNCISVISGSIAISVACFVIKSAWPLVAFLIIPKWEFTHNGTDESEEKENE